MLAFNQSDLEKLWVVNPLALAQVTAFAAIRESQDKDTQIKDLELRLENTTPRTSESNNDSIPASILEE